MDPDEIERRFRERKELMDFGWAYCLEIFPQVSPGRDPPEKLREVYEAKGREHQEANERMLSALGRAHGR